MFSSFPISEGQGIFTWNRPASLQAVMSWVFTGREQWREIDVPCRQGALGVPPAEMTGEQGAVLLFVLSSPLASQHPPKNLPPDWTRRTVWTVALDVAWRVTRVGEPGLELKGQFPEKKFSFSVAFPPVGLETRSYPETSVSSQTEMLQCLPITHGVSSFFGETPSSLSHGNKWSGWVTEIPPMSKLTNARE